MTDQEREIIRRLAAQDLAGVLEVLSAVAAGKSTPPPPPPPPSPGSYLARRAEANEILARKLSKLGVPR